MNLADVVVIALIALAVCLALRSIRRNARRGCSCCSDGCGCSRACDKVSGQQNNT